MKSMTESATTERVMPTNLQPTTRFSLKCLSVVMPVYNEVNTLDKVIRRVIAVPVPKELVIVDDFSTDGTRELLRKIEANPAPFLGGRDDVRIKIVFHERNKGKGAAVRTGIEHAGGDITIIQDADMEYDPGEYPKLLEPILSGDADVVYGSRFLGERRRVLMFWHTVGNRFLTLLSNICTNLNLTDMETCYKVFKTDIIKSIPLRSNRFGFEPEVTAKIAKLRLSIYELPISYRGRDYSEGKKINWKDGVSAIYTILKYWLVEDLFKEDSGHRTLRIMEGAGDYNRWLFDQCRNFLGKRVLEVGSGVGNITKFLMGKEAVLATDLNEVYLEELKRKFGPYGNFAIERFNLLDNAMANHIRKIHQPDSVVSMNVLEHIEDDETSIKNVNRALPMGGRVALVLPAHMALYSRMDKNLGHFRRYSRDQVVRLLQAGGFEVEESRYLNMLGALGWFVNGRILRRGIIPSRQLRVFDFLSKTLVLEKWIKPPFGISVLAVGRKITEA